MTNKNYDEWVKERWGDTKANDPLEKVSFEQYQLNNRVMAEQSWENPEWFNKQPSTVEKFGYPNNLNKEDEPPYKYNERALLKEVEEYVLNTYNGHYVGRQNIQSLDLIFSTNRGEDFCISNILKLAARFGRKEGKNRKDLLKIIHYAILSMYLIDKE